MSSLTIWAGELAYRTVCPLLIGHQQRAQVAVALSHNQVVADGAEVGKDSGAVGAGAQPDKVWHGGGLYPYTT